MGKVKEKDEMEQEYRREDPGVGVRGKYYQAYKKDHNLVLLKREVVKERP